MPRALNIAYLAGMYPRAVDTAIRNEVIQLRQQGHRVHTFSVRRAADAQLISEFHRSEAESTVYILSENAARLPGAALIAFARRPLRFLAALALALRTAAPGVRGSIWQIAYFLEAAFLARALRRLGVEHLHVHNGDSSASVAMLASAISGVPYSMTIHGPAIFRAPEKWALGEKIKRSKFTVCISEFTRSQCMIQVPYEYWHKLPIVRCGPDPAFLETEPPPMTDSHRIVWVGRLCEEKAVPIVLDAVRLLAAEDIDFQLAMVGDGPLRESVELMIRREGLENHVTMRGLLSTEDLVKEVVESRVLLIPSFAEGLPAVIFEAMAMRRPVISTNIAGIPELVEPGHNGWLVPASSVSELAKAMKEALAMPVAALEEMGERGRRAILERHDPGVEAAKLAELIRGSA